MVQFIHSNDVKPEDQQFIIDVREPDEFLQERIPGSKNIPLASVLKHVEELKGMEKVIISCRSGKRAQSAYEQLAPFGLENAILLTGGIMGWKDAHKPTESLKAGASVMQQVQMTVGFMILIGFFGGMVFSPLQYLIPVAGLGMVYAGISNTCALGTLIGSLPWNNNTPCTTKTTCGL